ncbi:hypothetical protein QE152_g39764, partial [Popillia japonica]
NTANDVVYILMKKPKSMIGEIDDPIGVPVFLKVKLIAIVKINTIENPFQNLNEFVFRYERIRLYIFPMLFNNGNRQVSGNVGKKTDYIKRDEAVVFIYSSIIDFTGKFKGVSDSESV